jgi:hypothetical protein
MADREIACPKCSQPMQEGYLVENARRAHWFEGRPRYWLGLNIFRWAQAQVPITTYRCTSRGYLESYAR